ncbi:MAG: ribosome assembly cofactor RimP [Bacteroidales bacterium]|nr:ribosome assembly cofactor RimP [Bacteroidales bacterium]
MIDKLHVLDVVNEALRGSDKFLVDMNVTTNNRIFVDIDGDNGVTIDDCVALSRAIEGSLDREVEDFELNVSSAGLDSPLKLARQYKKNIGQTLAITPMEGEYVEGELLAADDEQCTIQPPHGKKKPALEPLTFSYKDIKKATIVIKF